MPFKMSKTEKILTAIVGLALLGIGGLTIYGLWIGFEIARVL